MSKGQKATKLYKEMKSLLKIDDELDWTPRRFLLALLYRFYEDDEKMRKFVDENYPRGIFSFFNHVLAHKNKSSEWQAYVYFYIQADEKEKANK